MLFSKRLHAFPPLIFWHVWTQKPLSCWIKLPRGARSISPHWMVFAHWSGDFYASNNKRHTQAHYLHAHSSDKYNAQINYCAIGFSNCTLLAWCKVIKRRHHHLIDHRHSYLYHSPLGYIIIIACMLCPHVEQNEIWQSPDVFQGCDTGDRGSGYKLGKGEQESVRSSADAPESWLCIYMTERCVFFAA